MTGAIRARLLRSRDHAGISIRIGVRIGVRLGEARAATVAADADAGPASPVRIPILSIRIP